MPSGEGRGIDIKAWLFRIAYEEAKNTLKRRFGGERRKLQNYLEEVKRIKPVQEGNVEELEKFADTLVCTVVTLREHSRWSELESGSLLFTVVLEKIPKSMLSRQTLA